MQDLVTVGIPIYNNSDTVELAVRSVFNQTIEYWELILIDDGSTDGSVELVREINDPRVRVVVDGKHLGLAQRLNQIAQMASGVYLARMDADDVMHPDRLRFQIESLRNDTEISLVGSACYVFQSSNIMGIRQSRPISQNLRDVLRWGMFIHPTVLGYTEWFRENLYSPDVMRAEDRELWCRICGSTKVSTIAEPLLFYRETGGIKKNISSARGVRQVILKYGPEQCHWLSWRALYIQSFIRTLIYVTGAYLGLEWSVLKKRNTKIDAEEREYAHNLLFSVSSTKVPGW